MIIGSGAMAQLVARLVRNEKVRGSNPLSSTNEKTPSPQRKTATGFFIYEGQKPGFDSH